MGKWGTGLTGSHRPHVSALRLAMALLPQMSLKLGHWHLSQPARVADQSCLCLADRTIGFILGTAQQVFLSPGPGQDRIPRDISANTDNSGARVLQC